MRVRDHVLLSTAAAAALAPRLQRGVLGLWAGSVLIDADHYAWFCLRQRRLNPAAAVRFFNQANAPQHSATRALHTRVGLIGALALGARRRRLLPVAVGMGIHVMLDERYEARMDEARVEALKRDRFACQSCGTRARPVGTHVWHQPWLLPDYRTRNLISLCGPCHDLAHSRNTEPATWK